MTRFNDEDIIIKFLNPLRLRYKYHKAKMRSCISRQIKALDMLEDAYKTGKSLENCPLCKETPNDPLIRKCNFCIWTMNARHLCDSHCTTWAIKESDVGIVEFRENPKRRPYQFKRKRLRLLDKQRNTLKRALELV